MSNLINKSLSIFLVILLFSCDNQDDVMPDIGSISLLEFPVGTVILNGTPPTPSSESDAPNVINLSSDLVASPGSDFTLNFEFSSVNDVEGVYIQVSDEDSYSDVPLSVSGSSGQITVPISIAENVQEGVEFELFFCIYDENGLVSNVISSDVTLFSSGIGGYIRAVVNGETYEAEELFVGGELEITSEGYSLGITSADEVANDGQTANSLTFVIYGDDFDDFNAGQTFDQTGIFNPNFNVSLVYGEIKDGNAVLFATDFDGTDTSVTFTKVDKSNKLLSGTFSFSGSDDDTGVPVIITEGIFIDVAY